MNPPAQAWNDGGHAALVDDETVVRQRPQPGDGGMAAALRHVAGGPVRAVREVQSAGLRCLHGYFPLLQGREPHKPYNLLSFPSPGSLTCPTRLPRPIRPR